MTSRAPDPDEQLAGEIIRQNIAFHEAQARLYDLSHPELTNAYQRLLLARDVRRMRALVADVVRPLAVDVGAGTGRLSLALARGGFDVVAVDNSPAMLEVLRGRYERLPGPQGSLETVAAGAEALGPDLFGGRAVHAIGFSSVLHHLPDVMGVLRRAGEMLAPGGCLYVTHEPVAAAVRGKTRGWRAVRLLDTILRTPQQMHKNLVRRRLQVGPPPAAPLMDYHDTAGLEVPAIRDLLAELGCTVVMERRYKDRKMALVAVLDTYVFRTPNWRFALLAQKTAARE